MVHIPGLPERLAQGVAERVVTLVVDAIDMDALLARIDVDALIARIDVAAVLDRVDVDALVDRIDVEKLVTRIDLASTMTDTATTIGGEALDTLRRTAVKGDDAAARLASGLIGRR